MTGFPKFGVGRAFGLACFAGAVLGLCGKASAQYTCGGRTGPDVIVGDLQDVMNYTSSGGVDAISVGTTSCNPGTAVIQWQQAPANTHPVISINLYRYSTTSGTGHFEQIGMSWVKYAFCALQGSVCCSCSDPSHGCDGLAVGCSDPYTAQRNGMQSGLGPRYQINAHTGFYPAAQPVNPTGGNNGRTQFLSSDVTATTGGTAASVRFFVEGHYVTSDDALAGNGNNNESYRELSTTVTSGEPSFSLSSAATGFIANTQRAMPAVRAWKTIDPTITQTDVQVPGDGLIVVSSKATALGGGVYHYEYTVYNMNADRNVGSFSVPISDAIPASNIGFSCPVYRGGDGAGAVNESSTAWTSTKAGGNLTWSCETQAANNNANAIRWGTSYSFRFDAAVVPVANANIGFGLWKTGTPGTMVAAAQSPGQFAAPLSGAGGASPNPAQITATTLLTVITSPGTLPNSTGITVTANLSSIHGSVSQAFYDDGTHGDAVAGDGTYSVLATLTEPLSAGAFSLPFAISDAQGRNANGTIALTATAAPTGQCCTASCSVMTAYNCAQANGVYGGNGTACVQPPFNSNSTPIPINDNATTTGTITVPAGSGTISGNLAVTITANHTWVGDVTMTLSHGATSAQLMSHPGGAGNSNDLNGTYTFADSAATTFAAASTAANPIATGAYRPLQAFSAFNGQLFDGTWTLTLNDNAAGDTGSVTLYQIVNPRPFSCPPRCGSADFNHDGDVGTDADIEAFFACLGGNCCAACDTADFNGDGDTGTDADIESFFRVLSGGPC